MPAKCFLPRASPGAAIIAVAAATVLPLTMVPGLSAYLSSKLSLIKMMEYLAAENPSLFVATLHPGMVETEIFHKSGGQADQLPMDTGTLYVLQVIIRG